MNFLTRLAVAALALVLASPSIAANDVVYINGLPLFVSTINSGAVQAVAVYTPANAPLSVAGAASSNYAPSQVSVAATATSLIAARSGGRNAVIITNMSTTPVFLGGSGVTAATGGYLAGVVGASKVLPYNGAIYGITATGTASVSVEEIY